METSLWNILPEFVFKDNVTYFAIPSYRFSGSFYGAEWIIGLHSIPQGSSGSASFEIRSTL